MASRLTLSIKSLQTLRRAAGARRTVHSDEAGTILKITPHSPLKRDLDPKRPGLPGRPGGRPRLALSLRGGGLPGGASDRRAPGRAVAAALALAAAGFPVRPCPGRWRRQTWAVAALAAFPGASRSKKPEALFKRALLLTALFGAAHALLGWIYGTSAYESVSIAVEAVILGLSTYLLLPLGELEWPLGSGRLERRGYRLGAGDGRLRLGLFAGRVGLVQPAEVWHRWLVMGAALVGSGGGGAAMGTFVSVLLSLVGACPLGGTGLYGVGGLFGGLLARRGKAGVICGFVAWARCWSRSYAAAAGGVVLARRTPPPPRSSALTPRRWTARFSRAMPGTEARTHLELARERRLREAINSRLKDVERRLSGAGGSVCRRPPAGTGAGRGPAQRPGGRGVAGPVLRVQPLRRCWQESFYRSYWEFVDLVAVADLKGGAVTAATFPGALPPGASVPGASSESFNRAMSGRALQARGRGDASFDLVPQQLRGVAELIESTAEQVRIDTGRAEEIEAQLRDEFAVRRIDVADVRVVHPGSRPELEIVYRGPCDRCGRCVQVAAGVAEWLLASATRARPPAAAATGRRAPCALRPYPLTSSRWRWSAWPRTGPPSRATPRSGWTWAGGGSRHAQRRHGRRGPGGGGEPGDGGAF